MTYTPAIPALSIFFMGVTLVIVLLLFFGLFLFFRKKWNLKMAPFWLGAATFLIFALVLEQLLHMVVLAPRADGGHRLSDSPALFVLYGCLAAGIFEETGRYLGLRLLRKKHQGIATGLAFGIGHGGFEALVLVGTVALNNIILAVMSNAGIAGLLGDEAAVTAGAELLAELPPSVFLAAGVERIAAVTLHVALSVIVWHSINSKGRFYFYPIAILVHALFNVIAALHQAGVVMEIWVVEGIFILQAAVLAFIVWKVHKRVHKSELHGDTQFCQIL